jgi:hypothetical protein
MIFFLLFNVTQYFFKIIYFSFSFRLSTIGFEKIDTRLKTVRCLFFEKYAVRNCRSCEMVTVGGVQPCNVKHKSQPSQV